MNFFEKHPMSMIVIGLMGVSLSAVFAKYSTAPSLITAAYRLLWTVAILTPACLFHKNYRNELLATDKTTILLCAASGIFLALHFTTWFESLKYTSVTSSTTIVCTEVIWVAIGYRVFLKGSISKKALLSIGITVLGSVFIALSDYKSGGNPLIGDLLALFAAIMVAGYTLIGRVVRLNKDTSTTVYTYIVYIFCALSLLITAIVSKTPLTGYGPDTAMIGFLLCLFSTLLGHSVFSWCLKYFSPAFVSASKLCEPVIASILAIFLFREYPVLLQIIGSAIIIGGVLLFSKAEKGEAA